MDPTMQSPRFLRLPIGPGIDVPIPSGPHDYRARTWVGRVSDGISPTQGMRSLQKHATPMQSGVAEDDKTTSIPVLGTVRHRVDPERRMVVNTTESDHLLHPGNVHRSIVQDGADIYVQSDGYGTGAFPTLNSLLAKYWLWRMVDNDIRRELNPQIKPNKYASEIVRDSVAHSGVPDSRNVFEYGYPDAPAGRSAENASAAKRVAVEGPQTASPVRSVFETGTAPFVPSPSLSKGRSEADASAFSDGSVLGANAPNFQDRFAAMGAPPLRGLPGLLASFSGIDPANPFLPAPPLDEVPVRRLIGRLAE